MDRVELARRRHLAAEQPPQLGLQDVADERTLAAARHARHADQEPQRDLDIDALEVVVPHALEPECLARRLSAIGGEVDRVAAREKRSRDAPLARRDVVGRARCHDLTAPLAGAWSEVDHPVGRPDRVFVVLHHHDRVALIAESLERPEEFDVVAGMEADRRLVEHVEHAREPRTDLRGEPDPLAFAPGERRRLAVEGEVAEADLIEEREPARDLLHEFDGDHPLGVVEHERGEKHAGVGDRQPAQGVEREFGGRG